MGQILGPVKTKETKFWADSIIAAAASSMQGWRLSMEDCYSCILDMSGNQTTSYFAVFDGHGGNKVSNYASKNLHLNISSQREFTNDIQTAMWRGFMELDAEMQTKLGEALNNTSLFPTSDDDNNPQFKCLSTVGGSACISIILRDCTIYCANCGDSRAIISRLGIAEALSTDHKPSRPSERSRIVSARGWVNGNRVNGSLALSRSLGDYSYKSDCRLSPADQTVSAEPEIITREIHPDDEFIVMGCDGIWDVLTNQEVIEFVRWRLAAGHHPTSVCEQLMDQCLSPTVNINGIGCDNMTVIIICLLNGESHKDFQFKCSRPCLSGVAIDILG